MRDCFERKKNLKLETGGTRVTFNFQEQAFRSSWATDKPSTFNGHISGVRRASFTYIPLSFPPLLGVQIT